MTSSVDDRRSWLLLLYFLPSAQARARVQAWRRLQRAGAVLLTNSAYVLPHSAESREDFEWIRNEIAASGGDAVVLEARALEPAADTAIVDALRSARSREFGALADDLGSVLRKARGRSGVRRTLTQKTRRLRERFGEIARLDFFGAPGRDEAAALLAQLDEKTGRSNAMVTTAEGMARVADYRGKTWLTRPRPGVDRMSSAWLIRRFIDPDAAFVFGDPKATPKAIPFDTFEAEFGHHGTHCTFETFCERFGVADPAVRRIARIVHDLDLKAQTYGEPETATIGQLVDGLRLSQPDDAALLSAGIEMFDALYRSLAAAPPSSPRSKRKRRSRS